MSASGFFAKEGVEEEVVVVPDEPDDVGGVITVGVTVGTTGGVTTGGVTTGGVTTGVVLTGASVDGMEGVAVISLSENALKPVTSSTQPPPTHALNASPSGAIVLYNS